MEGVSIRSTQLRVKRCNSSQILPVVLALLRLSGCLWVPRFETRPEALTNTLLIAERCAAFDHTEDLGYEFPDFEGSARGGALESLATIWMRRTKMWTP